MSDVSDSDHDFYSFEGPVNGDIDLDANPAYYPPIFIAARDGDVQLMRAELASGTDPDLSGAGLAPTHSHITPLHVIVANSVRVAGGPGWEERQIHAERCPNESRLIECARLLLDAGADPTCPVPFTYSGQTTFKLVYEAVGHDHHEILAMLLEAGAGAVVNDTGGSGWTALAQAARSGHLECIHLLLAAGADINLRVQNGSLDDTPLETAIKWDRYEDRKRVFPVLLRAGAAIPPNVAHPYLRKVAAAGGFAAYERAHRLRLATILARVVFPRLPVEMVSHVVAFAFHPGDY